VAVAVAVPRTNHSAVSDRNQMKSNTFFYRKNFLLITKTLSSLLRAAGAVVRLERRTFSAPATSRGLSAPRAPASRKNALSALYFGVFARSWKSVQSLKFFSKFWVYLINVLGMRRKF
jgi:hypothetical protein